MKLSDALCGLRPGLAWTMANEDYSTLEWEDSSVIPPTIAEIEAYKQAHDYVALRAAAYPPLADFADAYVHAQNGDTAALQSYVTRCNAVKAKFPKGH